MIKHRVYRDNNLIVAVLVGDLDLDGMKELVTQAGKIVNSLKRENKSICILADLSEFGRSDAAARRWAIRVLGRWPVHKVAICGGSLMERVIPKILLAATRKRNILRYFDNETSARIWIEE